MIKAVIFDMDDTLYPEYEYVFSGFKAVDEYLISKGTFGFFNMATHLFEKGERGKIFNQALECLDVSYSKDDIFNLVSIYRNHLPTINLFPDALQILETLKDKMPLGLISDGYFKVQQMKVQALGLTNYIEKIVLTDEFGRNAWKPSPIPYQILSKHFNLNTNELIYVGDNESKDFITANQLGWTTVQIIRDSNEYKNVEATINYRAHFKIKSLIEVLEIINSKI